LRYEGAIFEILNAHTSLDLPQDISPEGPLESRLTAAWPTYNGEAPKTTKMSNPFRPSSGKTTPTEARDTPPRAIFSDYPAAHSAITNVPSAGREKIPSPTPGLPAIDNPYANLPPTIDLPETPAKHTGGPASKELKARIASSQPPVFEILERPETPLLPPTPVLTRPERRDASNQGFEQLFLEAFSEVHSVGEEPYELKTRKHDNRNDRSHLDDHDRESVAPRSVSTFGLDTPSPSSASHPAKKDHSHRRCLGADVHQSSTLDSVIGRYNDDSDFLRMREGSQRSIEINNSHEISSLSADEDGDNGFQDSTAGHTPPLANLVLARKAPERSAPGQPPRDPLPRVPSRGDIRDSQDMAHSEPTNYGCTGELLNMTGLHEERDLQAGDPAKYNLRRDLVLDPCVQLSATDRLSLVKQGFISGSSEISEKEWDVLDMSASGDSPDVGRKHGIRTDNRMERSMEGLFRPLADVSDHDTHYSASVGPSEPSRLVAHGERKDGRERCVRLRRRPNFIPGPAMTQLGQVLAAGGLQSSSSHDMSAYSSSRQGRTDSGRFQHDETLASLTGELPYVSQGKRTIFTKDIGGNFGGTEEDEGVVFNNDIVADKDEEDGDDGDWETLYESGLKAKISTKSYTNRQETATSLANMSSYGSLRGSVPAIAWGPLAGGARVSTNRPKAVLPYRSTGLSGMVPEYEAPDERYEDEEIEMTEITRRMRPTSLERPFPAFAATSKHSAALNQQVNAACRHPEPMSKEHKHPFSLPRPVMIPIDDFRKNYPIKSGITGEEVLYLEGAEDIEDGGEDTTQKGLVMSKKRNTQQFPAWTAGKGLESNMRDTRELSRPSDLSDDGSYAGSCPSGPALSTSSIIYDSQYLPQQPTGTFSKSTILGPNGNITGSFDGTGMRAVGSSEADFSTDSAMRSHKYERLDDERTLEQARPSTTNNTPGQSAPKGLKKVTFAKTSETQMVASVAVMTKSGLSISAPKEFKIPTT
jgi:hypothetical protein